MSKRPGHERFGLSLNHKKPKLDISVQKRNEINFGASTSTYNENNFKKSSSNPPIPNIWDDEDDNDLLIVSQMVENKIQTNENMFDRNANTENMFDNISITFEQFGNHVKSSTQMLHPPTKPTKANVDEDSSSLFDDFDFEWEENFKNANANNENDIFKKPTQINIKPLQKQDPPKPKLMSLQNEKRNFVRKNSSSDITGDKIHDAIEIDKLIENLERLQNENNKQTEQINILNEKIQTKEGEASILRHELKSSKQALDTLRVQKISENDNIRKEYQNKITELERNKNVVQAELNQKKIENVELKQKKAVDGNAIQIIRKYQNLSEINKLNIRIHEKLKIQKEDFPNEIFMKGNAFNYNLIENHFQNRFEEISSIFIEWNLNKNQKIHIIKIKNIFTDVFEKLISYIKINSGIRTVPENYDIDNNDCISCLKKCINKQNILHANKISDFERMIPFRRIMAVFCYIIRNAPYEKNIFLDFLKSVINSPETNFNKILELISNSVNKNDYMGIIECIALILTSFAKIEAFDEFFFEYLNIIVRCVPNLRVMAEISDCLQEISKNTIFLNKLCRKSSKFHISYSGNKKIIDIPKTGCILQTFCVILEYRIQQQDNLLFKNKFEIMRILQNYIKLLGNCYKLYPTFMVDPNLNNNSNLVDSSTRNYYDINHTICNCYALLCCSFVFVFNKFLNFWIEDKKIFDLNIVRDICKTGIIAICDIFDSYYQPVIVFIGNISIKKNLVTILSILENNKETLKIECENVSNKIKSSSIFTETDLNAEDSQELNNINGKKIFEQTFEKESFFS